MRKKPKFDIDFWRSDVEKAFYKIRDDLVTSHNMTMEEATEFLEDMYYTVASEFGN